MYLFINLFHYLVNILFISKSLFIVIIFQLSQFSPLYLPPPFPLPPPAINSRTVARVSGSCMRVPLLVSYKCMTMVPGVYPHPASARPGLVVGGGNESVSAEKTLV